MTDHNVNPSGSSPLNALGGVGERKSEETAVSRGADGFINAEPLSDGTNLWETCIDRTSHVHCPIEGLLKELKAEGGLGGSRLRALSEIQAILRATPAGLEPDEVVQVPAWHLVLLTRWAMERLG